MANGEYQDPKLDSENPPETGDSDLRSALIAQRKTDRSDAPPDPDVEAAGKRARAQILGGITVALTAEELSVLKRVADRQQAAAELAKRTEKEQSPENQLFQKLDRIHDRLVAEGLLDDAKLVELQIDRLQAVMEQAAQVIADMPDGEDKAYIMASDKQGPHGAMDKIKNVLSRAGVRDLNPLSWLPLSHDEGGGARRAQRGFTVFQPHEQSDPRYGEQLDRAGGFEPILSDAANRAILQELGILLPGQNLEDLPALSQQPPEGVKGSYGSDNNFGLSVDTPIAQIGYIEYVLPDGKRQRSLRMSMHEAALTRAIVRGVKSIESVRTG